MGCIVNTEPGDWQSIACTAYRVTCCLKPWQPVHDHEGKSKENHRAAEPEPPHCQAAETTGAAS